VREPVGETDRLDDSIEPAAIDSPPRDIEGQRDVLGGGQRRDQVVRLEDEPHLVPAKLGEPSFRQFRDLDVTDEHPAARGSVEPRHAMEQRGLAGPRGTHDRGELCVREFDAHVAERLNRGRFLSVPLPEFHRARGGRGPCGHCRCEALGITLLHVDSNVP
jgi:hypothetical protein